MKEMKMRTRVLSLLVGASLAASAPSAWAIDEALMLKHPPSHASRLAQTPPAASARIEVLVLEATMGPGGVASAVAHLPQLRQPPFASYTQIDQVSRTVLPLGAAESTATLPNGAASITSAGRGPNGRYTVTVNFSGTSARSHIEFVAAPGEPFFTVRSSRPDRALIVGFIVRQ